MGRRPTGTVEPLRSSIRLKFTVNGLRCVEPLQLAPTAPNLKAAQRLMARIQSAIDAGVYRRGDFFEDAAPTSRHTFREYAEDWLQTLVVAKSTLRSYRTALRASWIPAFGQTPLAQIRYSDIKAAVARRAKVASGKTINNHLIALRAVFDMAVKDGLITANPTDGIGNLPHQAAEPDPFEPDERDRVLDYMAATFPEPVWNYFTFAFFTGLRPSEQIALTWADIDWPRRKARVRRARVDWAEKATKTNRVRDVDLNDVAFSALLRQKAHTLLRGQDCTPIFNNPVTGSGWADEQVQRRRYYAPTLRALGLRHRDAYQTRHTFATTLLMGGINVGWIAKQLGHANITTTLTKYARWIEGADRGAEAARANALLSTNCPRKPQMGRTSERLWR